MSYFIRNYSGKNIINISILHPSALFFSDCLHFEEERILIDKQMFFRGNGEKEDPFFEIYNDENAKARILRKSLSNEVFFKENLDAEWSYFPSFVERLLSCQESIFFAVNGFEIVFKLEIKMKNEVTDNLMGRFMEMKEELFKEEDCFKNFLTNFQINLNNAKPVPEQTIIEEALDEIQLKRNQKSFAFEETNNSENDFKNNENEENYKKKLRNREGRFKHDPFQNFEKRRKRRVMQTQRLQKIFIEENKDEQVCSICLEKMKDFHAILNCQHAYCLECIKDWSQVCNLCPLCKKEFTDILHIDPCRTIIETIKVEPKKIHIEEEADDYPESDTSCYRCNRDNNQHILMVCDNCNFFCCHTYCDVPKLDFVPEDDWICRFCRSQEEEERMEEQGGVSERGRRREPVPPPSYYQGTMTRGLAQRWQRMMERGRNREEEEEHREEGEGGRQEEGGSRREVGYLRGRYGLRGWTERNRGRLMGIN